MKPTKKKPAKKRLKDVLEMYYGEKMNIDDLDYRWVDDRIKHFDKRKRLLTKEEMTIANNLWKKYHPSKNI